MAAPEPDFYTFLGVGRTASEAEIRAAYRRLARESHPDANPGPEAETRMRLINEAWETLRDPQRRSLYTRQLPRSTRVAARPATRPARAPAPVRPRPQAEWFAREDAPREEARAGSEYTGDTSINWYKEIGVREDASSKEILKVLARMAGSADGADITATEFTRRRTTMREAWAVLGDQYMRAAYDRARKHANTTSPDRQGGSEEPSAQPTATPPPGYRLGPISINGYSIDAGASLQGADLRGADLRGLDLAAIDLREAKLQGADLEAASLRKAKLQGADLSGANLRFTDLSNADGSGATLSQADLHGAALHATKLFRANLSGARFTNAVGPGINLDYADLSRADFSGARITLQLIERGTLSGTIMPDGTTTSPQHQP